MIEYDSIEKTSYGGEINYLKADEAWEIPAIRIYVCSHFNPIEGKTDKKELDTLEFIELTNKKAYDVKAYVRRILSYYHGDIGEMGTKAYYFRGISRLAAFLSWIPVGAPRGIQGVGTERSLRYLETNSFVMKRSLEEELYKRYRQLLDLGVKKEDARGLLPLSASTELILQIPPGRDVEKWANAMIRNHGYLGEAKEIGEIVREHNREVTGFKLPREIKETPESRFSLYSQKSMLEEYKKSTGIRRIDSIGFHYNELTAAVLTVWKDVPIFSAHQEVRNRQVYHYWPSWEDVIKYTLKKGKFYHPSRLSEEAEEIFTQSYEKAKEVVKENWSQNDEKDDQNWEKIEEALYAIPLGALIPIYASVISGRKNIKYTIALRTCLRAQEEIRGRYWRLAKYLEKNGFGEKLGPRCMTEGVCYEPGRKKCPNYKAYVVKSF